MPGGEVPSEEDELPAWVHEAESEGSARPLLAKGTLQKAGIAASWGVFLVLVAGAVLALVRLAKFPWLAG